MDRFPVAPQLPLQCLPNEIIQQRHSVSSQRLDRSLWQVLKQQILTHKWTPAAFLTSVYSLVLAKWSENKHFILNLPVFHRLPIHPQINQITGDFTSIIPLEINLNQPITFIQFVETIQKQLWNDLEHMSYNGVSFIRDLTQKHQIEGIVLPFVFTCAIDMADPNQKNKQDHRLFDQSPIYEIGQTPQVFLDHVVFEDNQHLSSMWMYVENLFPPNMIIEMHQIFIDLLQKLALSNDMWDTLVSVSLPTSQQDRRLIFNQTQWDSHVQEKLLHQLIIEQAKQTPQAWAILSSQQNLTYEQLINRVYSLAHHLRQHEDIQPNQLIAILMKKGWEQVVACLAIFITGAAYLPLDIDSPSDRLLQIIEETNVRILLTQSHSQHAFPHLKIISLDTFIYDQHPQSFPMKEQSFNDLAYVIYTSGSTGKPKGVMISHQAVLNTILDINSRLEISFNDRILALSHLNFDLSVYDLFGMLIAGGTIVIPDHEQYKNPQHWYQMVVEHHVTIWNTVPMLMQMFVEHLQQTPHDSQLRHVLLSGDWIPLSLPQSIRTTFGQQITITSLGGATEASIWSIAFTLPQEMPQHWKSIPYGTPLRNQQYYVYDAHLNHCPDWVIGDLYIGGVGLANGYWRDEEKTQSSFPRHPRTGERLYRTGDQGRFVPDGYIEFMGRNDFQVKIHGHRIELGEIEYHLQKHSDIHQAIVTVDQISEQLVAYLVPHINVDQFKTYGRSQIEITDPIERTNFKIARHNLRHREEGKMIIPLLKPKRTEKLINTYYERKSYRQFTNEIIEISTMEKLLTQSFNVEWNKKIPWSKVNFDSLSQLLSVFTSINVSDQPLPKYRYASAGSLYPVQVYIELSTSIDIIPSGLYYHNPDEHTLDLMDNYVSNEDVVKIRLHLVGRSSAIAPLYGRRLGREFCTLETGYMVGLLGKEASKIGLVFSKVDDEESSKYLLNIDENDTHYCFTISSDDGHRSNDRANNFSQCIVYLKNGRTSCSNHWFIYDKDKEKIMPLDDDDQEEITKEEMPLVFDVNDDTQSIFHDCQSAIFFVGQSKHRFDVGCVSHLLMDSGLDMNIGMCPIGTPISLPRQINMTLDRYMVQHPFKANDVILHTLLLGKITNQQKSAKTISQVKTMSDWKEVLKAYLHRNLPSYMVPSHYITLASFPLNTNGKIDRKALPQVSVSILAEGKIYIPPTTELEKTIINIWRQFLPVDQLTSYSTQSTDIPISHITNEHSRFSSPLSTTTSFFDLGGDSLLLIQIYQHYQSLFGFDSQILTIRPFFLENTLAQHAKLLQTSLTNNTESMQWHTLHINKGNQRRL